MHKSPPYGSIPQSPPQKSSHRLKQLERQVTTYRSAINQKNQQIDYLNQRHSQLMDHKSQSSSNKKKSDIIYQSSLQEQIERLNLKLMEKGKQYQRLYQQHTVLQNEMATLEDFATDLDRERKFLADKLASLQIHTEGDQVVGQLQNKLVLMSTQIMRLGHLNRNKTQECNNLKFQLTQKNQQSEHYQSQLTQKQKTLLQYRQRVRALQNQLHNQQLNNSYQSESTYKILSLQIQRLNMQLSTKIQQQANLQNRNHRLEQQMDSIRSRLASEGQRNRDGLDMQLKRLEKVNNDARIEIDQFQANIKKLRRENIQISQQNQRGKRTIRKLEEELQEVRNNFIKDQNQKIRIQVQINEKTIKQQKTVIQNMHKQMEKVSQQKQVHLRNKYQQQIYSLRNQLQQAQYKNSSLTQDLMKYQQKLVMLSQQIQRLSLQNLRFQQQNAKFTRLEHKLQTKQRQLRQIQRNRDSITMEIRRDKDEMERLKTQLRQLQSRNRDLEGRTVRIVGLQDQLNLLNQKLYTKQRQCKLLQQKTQQLNTLRTSRHRLDTLQHTLQTERAQNRHRLQQLTFNNQKQKERLQQTIHKLELKIVSLNSQQANKQSNHSIFAQQIRRLNQVLSQSSQTVIDQKREIMGMKASLQAAEATASKIKTMYMSNQKFEQELQKHTEIYKKEIKMHQQQNANLRTKNQELYTSNTMYQKQVFNIRNDLQDTKQFLRKKQFQVQNLLQDVRYSRRNEQSLHTLIQQIKQSNLRLQHKLESIEQDYISRLQQKSQEKQYLESQYLGYMHKLRESENQYTALKYELSGVQSKLDIALRNVQELQFQRTKLQGKIERYEDQRQKVTEEIRGAGEEMRNRLNRTQQDNRRYTNRIEQLQGQLTTKVTQINSLQSVIHSLEQQSHSHSLQVQDLRYQISKTYETSLQQLRMNLQLKQNQLANSLSKLRSVESELRQANFTLDKNAKLISEYEGKLAMLSQQVQRINQILYQKGIEIQTLQSKYREIYTKLEQEMANSGSNKQAKEIVQILTIQVTRLNTTLCESLQNIRQLQQQLGNKTRQHTHLAQLYKKSQQSYKDRIYSLQLQLQRVTKQSHKSSTNINLLNRKIQDLKQIEKQFDENRRKIQELTQERNRLKNNIQDLETEVSRVKNNYQNLLQDQHHSINSKMSIKISQLQQSKKQLQRKITMLVTENQQLVTQIQTLKKQLDHTDKQYRQINRKYIKQDNELTNLKRQKQKYQLLNEQILAKIEKINIGRTMEQCDKEAYEFRVKHLQAVIKEYEGQMVMMKQEMNRERSKSRDGSSVGSSNARLSSNNNGSLIKGVNASGDLQQKYNILEGLHLKLKREADGLREKVTEYQFKMKKLKGQFELINKLTHEYKDQNQYLRQQNHSQCVYVGKSMQNQAVSMPTSSTNQTTTKSNEQMLIKHTLTAQIDRLGLLNNNMRRQIEELRLQVVDAGSIKARYEELLSVIVVMAVGLQAKALDNNS